MKAQKSFLNLLLITWVLAIALAIYLDNRIQKSEQQTYTPKASSLIEKPSALL